MIQTQVKREDRGKYLIRRVQDVESIIDNNKRLQGEEQSRKSDLRHIAAIPLIFYEQWLNEEYARGNVNLRLFSPEMDKIAEKKLRDPDWAFLRTDNKSNPFHLGWR